MNNWEVRYSKYVGDLSVFDKKAYSVNADELQSSQIKKDVYVTVNSLNNQPLMVEILDADRKIVGIDKMDKSSIIKKVKEYIS